MMPLFVRVKTFISRHLLNGHKKCSRSNNSQGRHAPCRVLAVCVDVCFSLQCVLTRDAVYITASCWLVLQAPGSRLRTGANLRNECSSKRCDSITIVTLFRCLLHAMDIHTSSVSHVHVIDPKSVKKDDLYGTPPLPSIPFTIPLLLRQARREHAGVDRWHLHFYTATNSGVRQCLAQALDSV